MQQLNLLSLWCLCCRDEDDLLNTQCPQHLELRWQTEVSSSIYATPLIADINRSVKIFIFSTANVFSISLHMRTECPFFPNSVCGGVGEEGNLNELHMV